MRISVNVDALCGGAMGLPEKFAAVAEAGFDALEFWGWYDGQKDERELKRLSEGTGIAISMLCTRFVTLLDPARRGEYIEGLKKTVESAMAMNVKNIVTQVGDEIEGVGRDRQADSLIGGLKACSEVLSGTGITLLYEPLNIVKDHAGYFLSRADEAFAICRAVGAVNVKVLYDIYHQQLTDGNIIKNITGNMDCIAYFHAANAPGRDDLGGHGELDYRGIFKAIKDTGYAGFIGLEYFRKMGLRESLADVRSLLPQP
ncbi:MAG: TIM barrel protein [Oscillospiraceae bacterium]|nr:TIM barrel protein [Oscillospiraceae bacterium]